MVYAVLEDNTVHLIKNWRMSRFEKRIAKMILMDGNEINYQLKNYDKYIVEFERSVLASGTNPVSRETVYGLHDYTKNKEDLLKIYEDSMKRVYINYTKQEDIDNHLLRLKATYGRLLKTIEQREVAFISILIQQGTESTNDLTQRLHLVNSDYKRGIGVPRDNKHILGNRYSRYFKV